jgi:hypothetical protein
MLALAVDVETAASAVRDCSFDSMLRPFVRIAGVPGDSFLTGPRAICRRGASDSGVAEASDATARALSISEALRQEVALTARMQNHADAWRAVQSQTAPSRADESGMRQHPIAAGIVIGATIGLAVGTVSGLLLQEHNRVTPTGAALFSAGVGAGIGALIGLSIDRVP